MKQFIVLLLLAAASHTFAQNRFSGNEFSVNAFRNPSIGLEFRHQQLSVHAGYYITALEPGITTKFMKVGLTTWFLPVGQKEHPSSFYAGASYLRGLNLDYKDQNALGLEAGFRWMIWEGLNFRIGGIALIAKDQDVQINPTPGLSYSFFINSKKQ
ncbi:hypothetical protein [Haliscomenobacter sp.]|uniref:hypothetical protein n=1 Tax=Haliscomenobacter sp. TaxID=2717303 RepID=UPI0035933C8A